MRRRFYLRVIFAVCVTMGLLVAPFAAPAMAKLVPSAMQMSGDMPCCPNGDGQQPPQNDGGCKDCLSMGMCSLNNFQALPAAGLRADFGAAPFDRIVAANDNMAPALAASPPARPPRS
jgi:hypothetical protein